MTKEKLGTLTALLAGISFATLAIFSKSAYQGGANVPTVLFLRFTGAALFFWLFYLLKPQKIYYDNNTKLKLFLLGALGYGVMSSLFLFSVSRIPASVAGMLLYMYPSFVTIVSVLLKLESMTKNKCIALILTIFGIFLVLGVSFKNLDLIGVITGVTAPCVYTAYIIGGSKVLKDLEPLSATMYMLIGTAFANIMYVMVTGTLSFEFTKATWLMVVGLIFISTIFALSSFWWSITLIGPSKTSIITSIEPLVIVILAYFAFNETLSYQQCFGGVLILLGVLILQYPCKEDKET